jgi:hypothetical protein
MKNALAVVTVLALGFVTACGENTRSRGTGGTAGTGGSGGAGTGGSSSGGSNSGGSGGSGGYGAIGGTGGASTVECQKIDDDYKTAVGEATACNPLINAVLCTQLTSSGLACGCPMYINPANTQALTKMYDLKDQWDAKKCSEVVVCDPAPSCPAPSGATCVADATGSAGNCVNDYGT